MGMWDLHMTTRDRVRRALVAPRDVALGWLASPYAVLLLILAIGFGFYAQTLGFWFFYDDFWFLMASKERAFPSYTFEAFDYRSVGPVPEFLYRPLFVVWFYGLFQAFGLHAWAYHLLGVSVHLVNAALLWTIARKITGRDAIAHISALIFALHPSYAVAVAFVTNNIVVFSTFAFLTTLLLFLRYLDGGARRLWYYGASFTLFIAALLLHPETLPLFAVLTLALVLLRSDGLRRMRDVRSWVPLAPFLAVATGYVIVQALAREAEPTGFQTTFKLGSHIASNYIRYVAFAIDPFRAAPENVPFLADAHSLGGLRTMVPFASACAAAVLLLAVNRSRPYVSLFALCWFLLALLPLTTWTAGAFARKLYVAGPALALLVAYLFVTVGDYLATRTRLRLSYLALPLALIIAIPLGIRVTEMTNAFYDATGEYRTIIGQVRQSDAQVEEGGRLYLVGVPWIMIIWGPDSAGLASGIRLYRDNVPVDMVVNEAQLELLPVPPGPNDVIIRFQCPPICQPPFK